MPSITRNLNILARCGNQFRNAMLAGLGLTCAQAPYLLHICARPGLSQERLARALHVNPSSAARQLSALEGSGFIERRVSPQDKRLMEIHPTEKGREALPLIHEANARWNAILTEGLAQEQLEALDTMLDHLRLRAVAWDDERTGWED